MIDFHSHFLPDIDDGAGSYEESLSMLRDSVTQGVNICVATPHCIVHSNEDIIKFIDKRKKSAEKIITAISNEAENYPKIVLGAEVYLDNNILNYPDVKKLCMGNTDYMLLEMCSDIFDLSWTEWIYSMCIKGIKPIIAHVNRYGFWQDMVGELQGLNLVYQVNASSFLTYAGRKQLSKLLETGEKIIVSSDMHNMKSRPCNFAEAYKAAKKKFPRSAADLFEKPAVNLTSKDLAQI